MTGTLGSRKSQSLFYWKLLCNKIETIYLKKLCWVTILVLLETPLQYFFSYKSHGQAYKSQSLFYWKLLCNANRKIISAKELESQSLFYWKHFCKRIRVTILVLLETPLQYSNQHQQTPRPNCHNPCFTGNSFAIKILLHFC